MMNRKLDAFNLWDLIHESHLTLSLEAEKKKLPIKTRLNPKLPKLLLGDPRPLKQVFLSLLSNAVNFTDQGEIILRSHTLGDTGDKAHMRFEVEDTGPGIREEELPRMWEADGGGLSKARKIVEELRGRMGVVTHEGLGSMFWFEVELPQVKCTSKIICTDRLQELAQVDEDGSQETLRLLIKLFLQNCRLKILDMQAYFLLGEFDEVKYAAHSLKSSCLDLGVPGLAAAARRIEKTSEGLGSKDRMGRDLDLLGELFDQVRQELEKLL